jgi:pimeloyl-ACP methyl ester carboxylesterase
VRDLHQAWYHRGIPRQGSRSLSETAERLKELIEPHGVERMVTIGNSSGGYAALAFGALLGADVGLAFSPQTTIDRADMAAMDDHRWDEQLQRLWERGRLDERWTDLRRALPSALGTGTSLRVYYNERLPVDRLHAEHLDGLDGVTLFPFGFGSGHYLVNTLRKRGLLEQILLDAVNGPDERDVSAGHRSG